MKCVILAGGSGDSLWPLSRRQFPKQFMKIKEGRSILQETVVRNMPFCEEFIIVTNESYKNIVNGQMKAFQSYPRGYTEGNRSSCIVRDYVCQPVRISSGC